MKKIKRTLKFILPLICILVGGVIILYCTLIFRFLHTELTETQILLFCWKEYVVGILLFMIGYYWIKWAN